MSSNFIRCPSCGFCIASYLEFFTKARSAYSKEIIYQDSSKIKDYDPEKLALNSGSTPDLENLFLAIGINNRCCRMRLLTPINSDEDYK
jgi:DNA-directed RNA polymerase subunit N (RpoN/RPB10)